MISKDFLFENFSKIEMKIKDLIFGPPRGFPWVTEWGIFLDLTQNMLTTFKKVASVKISARLVNKYRI